MRIKIFTIMVSPVLPALLFFPVLAENLKESKPLTGEQIQTLQDLTTKANSLQKEANDLQRAITAEREVLQLKYDKIVLQACAGKQESEICTLNTSDADPRKWSAVITKAPAKEAALKK